MNWKKRNLLNVLIPFIYLFVGRFIKFIFVFTLMERNDWEMINLKLGDRGEARYMW